MASKDEIDAAIGAHGMWKARLRKGIETGQIEVPLQTIRADDQCAFGKWLFGTTLDTRDKQSAHYTSVRDLHKVFHQTAARVAELVSQGKIADAEKMMALGGEYTAVSAKLTTAMTEWKKAVG